MYDQKRGYISIMSLSPIRKVMLGRVHNLIVTVVNTEKFYLIKRCIERIYEQKSSAAFPPTKPGLTSSILPFIHVRYISGIMKMDATVNR